MANHETATVVVAVVAENNTMANACVFNGPKENIARYVKGVPDSLNWSYTLSPSDPKVKCLERTFPFKLSEHSLSDWIQRCIDTYATIDRYPSIPANKVFIFVAD